LDLAESLEECGDANDRNESLAGRHRVVEEGMSWMTSKGNGRRRNTFRQPKRSGADA